jgi:hypothetical protein
MIEDRPKELTDSQKILAEYIADLVEKKLNRRENWYVRLWVWVKKVLSFASSEANKIRLDE